jgi:predicted ATPase
MKLDYVDIKNFRSIKNQLIRFDDGCQVLVGINEAGKSNILRALSLLDPNAVFSNADIRIELEDEKPGEDSHVRFVFKLNQNEIEEVYEAVRAKFHARDIEQPIVQLGEKKYTLREFCSLRNEAIYTVNIREDKRSNQYWNLYGTYKVIGGWRRIKLPTEGVRAELAGKPETLQIIGVDFVNTSLYKAFDGTLLTAITASEISDMIGAEAIKIVKRELPNCVYWKYSDEYLLPSRVNSVEFAKNPDACIPLRGMFELAGYTGAEIGEAITQAKSQAPHIYTNLLKKVGSRATKYLRGIWKDHKTITIELGKNGDFIEPVIKDDQVALNFENRSDGFKRFVSFLLIISAKVHTDTLTDTLILVDEPEIALHPSGARALMKELIEIGNKNYVVYSTHSIFMIDKENIERHLIVEKKGETTVATKAEKSRVQDEEVLYSAIGFSMFETLKEKNIIFEGWNDKRLFEAGRLTYLKANQDKKEALNPIGLTFAEGIKDVKNVAKFLELANRGCLIISDADGAGKQHKSLYESERGYGRWITYSDIFGDDASYVTA